jgi:hypothetical protein
MDSQELHEDLAKYYRGFRGVSVPETFVTRWLWEQIEMAESLEGVDA